MKTRIASEGLMPISRSTAKAPSLMVEFILNWTVASTSCAIALLIKEDYLYCHCIDNWLKVNLVADT
jgi:hypothetical protein